MSASGGRWGAYAGDPAGAAAHYAQWPYDRITAAKPILCSHCGAELVMPGTYYGEVSHSPNDGKYYHAHCWRAAKADRSPQGRDKGTLGSVHESGGPKGICPNSSSQQHQER